MTSLHSCLDSRHQAEDLQDLRRATADEVESVNPIGSINGWDHKKNSNIYIYICTSIYEYIIPNIKYTHVYIILPHVTY